jgi:hypothetical protein
VSGSCGYVSSSRLLIRTHNRARRQAEIPLTAPSEIVEPPLCCMLCPRQNINPVTPPIDRWALYPEAKLRNLRLGSVPPSGSHRVFPRAVSVDYVRQSSAFSICNQPIRGVEEPRRHRNQYAAASRTRPMRDPSNRPDPREFRPSA